MKNIAVEKCVEEFKRNLTESTTAREFIDKLWMEGLILHNYKYYNLVQYVRTRSIHSIDTPGDVSLVYKISIHLGLNNGVLQLSFRDGMLTKIG